MGSSHARATTRAGRIVAVLTTAVLATTTLLASSGPTAAADAVTPTTTVLTMNADGTGTVQLSVEGGGTATGLVDLWVDKVWQRYYVLADGRTSIDVGEQPLGDHWIAVRYRGNTAMAPSVAGTMWTAPGTVAVATTTRLTMNADGTGTVQVSAVGGGATTAVVDLWVDKVWQRYYVLADGRTSIDVGDHPLGDHWIAVRYRGNSTSAPSVASTMWTAPGTVAVATTTRLTMNADGTGTVQVGAAGGGATTAVVDLWVDKVWQRHYVLTGGRASIDVGDRSLGDHWIAVRYRGNSTSAPSVASTMWTAPGTVAVPTTTTLTMTADGTGTVRVSAEGGAATTAPVDLWVDKVLKGSHSLTNGQASIDLGPLPGGDHLIAVRYRGNSTTAPSLASRGWSVTTADQVPTSTSLTILPDGTGMIRVTAEGVTPTNQVDLWVNGTYERAYTLTQGQATIDLGTRAGGELPVAVRYRPSADQLASTDTQVWSVDTSPTPTASECGETVLKPDGQPWTCSFADNFDSAALDTRKWHIQTGAANGHEDVCFSGSDRHVAVTGGQLELTIRRESMVCGQEGAARGHTSGMVTTHHKWSQQYGRFEARIRNTAATTAGLHEAFWMWPDDRYPEGQGIWPANGEIDIVETRSSHPELAVPYLHTALDSLGSILTGTTANTSTMCHAERGVFNTYTLEWAPDRIEIFVNGRSCLVNTSGDEAFRKRYIFALTQGLGRSYNDPTADTPIPATMSIDYVRAWS